MKHHTPDETGTAQMIGRGTQPILDAVRKGYHVTNRQKQDHWKDYGSKDLSEAEVQVLQEIQGRSKKQEAFLISYIMNPTGPNEDFQTSQVRRYAEAIYKASEDKLVDAVVTTLGLQDDKDIE